MLGRSDIVEGRPQAGEVPDLAPPPSHGPRLHTCRTAASSFLSLTNARGRARKLPPAARASGVCAGGHEQRKGVINMR